LLSTCFARNYNHSNTLLPITAYIPFCKQAKSANQFSSDYMKPDNSVMWTGFFSDNNFNFDERKLKQTVIPSLLGKVICCIEDAHGTITTCPSAYQFFKSLHFTVIIVTKSKIEVLDIRHFGFCESENHYIKFKICPHIDRTKNSWVAISPSNNQENS